ncbi:MAG: hypothetical protein D6731_20515 [Planctomycetota bacterium]|nr:MAG: hypothetical protein D6731_20515 [Planctomycetota bacterium]
MRVLRRRRRDREKCPYCHELLGGAAPAISCLCGASYHAACAEELGACAVLGCERLLAVRDEGSAGRVSEEETDPAVREFLREASALAARRERTRGLSMALLVLVLAILALAAPWLGSARERPRAHRPPPPPELLAQRGRVEEGLLELARSLARGEPVEAAASSPLLERLFLGTDPESGARHRALLLRLSPEELQSFSELLDLCRGGPVAGSPITFAAHVMRTVREGVPPGGRDTARALVDAFFFLLNW